MLKRWPNGVGSDPFYNKRAKPGDAMETVEIRFPSQRPGLMRAPRTVTDILRMAQLNCLDLNPWNARAEDIEHPDELRIDVDPQPGTHLADATAVAGVGARARSPRHGSGRLGEDVWQPGHPHRVPHRAELDSSRSVRRAALAFAREIERRAGGTVTTAWWKEERGERVFIDYNQNARDRTIASAYSVRPRPDATVSAPVTWDELPDVETEDFTMMGFRKPMARRR